MSFVTIDAQSVFLHLYFSLQKVIYIFTVIKEQTDIYLYKWHANVSVVLTSNNKLSWQFCKHNFNKLRN